MSAGMRGIVEISQRPMQKVLLFAGECERLSEPFERSVGRQVAATSAVAVLAFEALAHACTAAVGLTTHVLCRMVSMVLKTTFLALSLGIAGLSGWLLQKPNRLWIICFSMLQLFGALKAPRAWVQQFNTLGTILGGMHDTAMALSRGAEYCDKLAQDVLCFDGVDFHAQHAFLYGQLAVNMAWQLPLNASGVLHRIYVQKAHEQRINNPSRCTRAKQFACRHSGAISALAVAGILAWYYQRKERIEVLDNTVQEAFKHITGFLDGSPGYVSFAYDQSFGRMWRWWTNVPNHHYRNAWAKVESATGCKNLGKEWASKVVECKEFMPLFECDDIL